jgi:hypothetical protein
MSEPNESRPSSNIAWFILAGALGLVAVGGRNSSKEAPTSAAINASKEASKEGTPAHVNGRHSLDPMDDFFALDNTRRRPFTDNSPDTWDRDYLIVTVPDPVDSQFGYSFDEHMDSIQRALEMGGYVIDRAWLPWELDKSSLIRTKIVTDWRQLSAVVFPFRGRKDEENTNHREETPGTLLFRSTHPKHPAIRIVFLVGENPTCGVDKRALTQAIELICVYPPTKGDPSTIRIVGPVCSGSRTSMQMVLQNYKHKRDFKFEVISGGATEVKQKALAPDGGNVHFKATVNHNNLVRQATLHYLYSRNESRSNDHYVRKEPGSDEHDLKFEDWLGSVALLTESNTSFGQMAIQEIGKPKKAGQAEEKRKPKGNPILELSFPLRMATLRSRYEEARRREEDKLSLPDFDSLVPRLSNKTPNQDSIPLQDPATTTSINGQVLQNILSIIRRRHIHYVGITASDVRDQIMLASAIRDYCPAVQIFFIGCDRMVTLPEYSYYLKGTIIGSTYPLIPENPERTDPKKKNPLIFPSQEAQGCFNAILAQTRGEKWLVEYRPPHLPDVKGDEKIWLRPPVWISMIGPNGDIVPLQFFTAPGENDEREYVWIPLVLNRSIASTLASATIVLQSHPLTAAACSSYFLTDGPAAEPPEMPLDFPDSAILPLVLVGTLCLLVVCYALFNWATPQLFWTTGQNSEWPGFLKDYLYRAICLISLIFLLVPLIELCWIKSAYIQWEEKQGFVEDIILALPVGLLFFLALALFPPVVKKALDESPLKDAPPRWAIPALYTLVVLLYFVAIVYVWYHNYLGDGLDSWKALFFDRALNLTTGVSPLLPLALLSATFFFWAFFQLKKSHLAERFSMPCPYPGDSPAVGSFKEIRKMDRKLRDEIRASWEFVLEKPFAVSVAVVIAVTVVTVCVHRLSWLVVPMPEGRGWDRVFFFGFVLGYIVIALNLVRFLLLWKRLKKLLHEIALVRMMNAFERLPHKVAVVFGGYFSTQRPRLSQLRIPHHQLGLLRIETERLAAMLSHPEGPSQEGDSQGSDQEGAVAGPPPNGSGSDRAQLTSTGSEVEGHVPKSIQEKLSEFKEDDFQSQSGAGTEEEIMGELSNKFCEMTGSLLTLLPYCWPKHSFEDAFGSDDAGRKLVRGRERSEPDRPVSDSAATAASVFQHWVQLAEVFIAMQVVIYLSQFFIQLRNLAWSIIVCGSLLLLGATSYPFQPERLILYLLLALIGSSIAGIVFVLVRINQDELVSRIMRTTPNKFQFDWGFVSSFFTYIVPMGTVVALQMSGTFRFLLEPLVHLVR